MSIVPGIYGWSNGTGGVHWYRQAEPLRVAAAAGIHTGAGNRLDNEVCEAFDTVLVHMLWDETNSRAWERLAALEQHRLIFDIDDVMWEPDWMPFSRHYTPDVLRRVWSNIAMAHVVTTPSDVIAEKVSHINPNVHVCPNTVPEYLLRARMPRRPHPVPHVRALLGYQGSPSHSGDWPAWLIRQVTEFLDQCPEWGVHFWGPTERLDGWPRNRTGNTPWKASVPDYYRSLSMDIGLGPLADTPFNRGKSGLRAIEYAALGIPAVLSAGPAYDPWVEHGTTGLLLQPGDSWLVALRQLADDDELRARMSAAARTRAAAWTTEANLSTWVEAWNSV